MVLTLEPGLGLGDFAEFNKVCGLFLNEPSVPVGCISDCWKSTRRVQGLYKTFNSGF